VRPRGLLQILLEFGENVLVEGGLDWRLLLLVGSSGGSGLGRSGLVVEAVE
jgi:hypothetical protein